jgi:hypothetical protein
MPIYRLLQSEGFDAEQSQAMGIAFEGILQELQLQDRDDPLCTLVAQTLIQLGLEGIRTPAELHTRAIELIKR